MTTEISLPQDLIVSNRYVLSKDISALKLITTGNGRAVSASFVQLPSGGEVHGFGQCFDARSLLVRFDGQFYVVFEQDLDSAELLASAQKA